MKYALPLFFLFLAISCQKADQLTYTEKRVVGSWFYTNVDYTPRWSLKKDLTKDYFGQKLTFNDDFSFSLEFTQTAEVFQGVWQLNQVNTYNGNTNANSWTNQLIISYENNQTGELVQLVWDQFSVTKNRIMANNSGKDGFYCYELKRF